MPHRRVAQFRTASTFRPCRRRDRFDRITVTTAVFGVLTVNAFVVVPVLEVLGVATVGWSVYPAWILICLSADLAVLRGTWVLAQRLIRPRVFDREQRNNEIVPPSDRSHTRA